MSQRHEVYPADDTAATEKRARAPRWRNHFRSAWIWIRSAEPSALLTILAMIAGTWLFIALAGDVSHGGTDSVDRSFLRALRDPADPSRLRGPAWLPDAARDITALGSTSVVWMVAAFLTIGLWISRRRHQAAALFLTAAGGQLLVIALKSLVARPRPDAIFQSTRAWSTSFPSGHALQSAVMYLSLAFVLASFQTSRALKIYIVAAAALITLLVGASRVVLGVHYPTDVLAGWTAGLVWALFCWLVSGILQRRRSGSMASESVE